MKKVAIVIMLFIMSVLLIGCNKSNMEQNVQGENTMDDSEENELAKEEAEKIKKFETMVVGEWMLMRYYGDSEIAGFVINEDKTLLFNGKEYTWEIKAQAGYDENFRVITNEDETGVSLNLDVSVRQDGTATIYCPGIVKNGKNDGHYEGNFCRKDDYQEVKLTKENFFDYFYYHEVFKPTEYDAFGEVLTSAGVTMCYALKPEYKMNITLSEVNIKYLGQYVECPNATFDDESMTYQFGETIREEREAKEFKITEMWEGLVRYLNGEKVYCVYITGTDFDEYEEGKYRVYYRKVEEIIDVVGTIYLLK